MISSSIAANLENLVPDTWVKATWEEYTELSESSLYDHSRFYYDYGYIRIEMAALDSGHGQDNNIVANIVNLFATVKNIRIKGLANTTFQKPSIAEFQPDLAFYIGTDFQFPPRNNSPINLNDFPPPALVIEIGATSLSDDLGRKRLLYERLGVREYWVVDVNYSSVIAFGIYDGRSGEIEESLVLPGLSIALVGEALERSHSQDDGEINRWLLQTFSQG